MTTFTVIAPTGQPCDWTRAGTTAATIRKLLGAHHRRLWDYAQTQGYRIRREATQNSTLKTQHSLSTEATT